MTTRCDLSRLHTSSSRTSSHHHNCSPFKHHPPSYLQPLDNPSPLIIRASQHSPAFWTKDISNPVSKMEHLLEPSMSLPIIDLDIFLQDPTSEASKSECLKAAQALITYGALVLHDSRVSESDNASFLDLLEDYFAQPDSVLKQDERPELGFQVGVTLENTEKPKCAVDEPCLDVIRRLAPEERPLDISGHQPDPKCRFFWRMSERPPYETEFPGLNAENVVPEREGIRERWEPVMNLWGTSMKHAYVTRLSGGRRSEG
jgi:hypothetical protein